MWEWSKWMQKAVLKRQHEPKMQNLESPTRITLIMRIDFVCIRVPGGFANVSVILCSYFIVRSFANHRLAPFRLVTAR